LYRFSSKEFHANSGLVYYLYRYYDPSLQRWVNRDPIQESGGPNLYSFVRNGTIDWFDAFGEIFSTPNQLRNKPGVATIICQGGQYVIVDNRPKGYPSTLCTQVHEEQHIKDWKEKFGENSCQGVPDGNLPRGHGDRFDPDYANFFRNTECNAFKAEKACLIGLLCLASTGLGPGVGGENGSDAVQSLKQINGCLAYYKCN
jgi:RHS repeat-associated protein